MKIHNPNGLQLDDDLDGLRNLLRADLDRSLEEAAEAEQQRGDGRAATAQREPGRSAASANPQARPGAGRGQGAPGSGKVLPNPLSTAVPAVQNARKENAARAVQSSAGGSSAQSVASRAPTATDRGEETRPDTHSDASLRQMKARQSQLAHIIAACLPLEALNPELLRMDRYPAAEQIVGARRIRDLWLVLVLLFAGIAALGWWQTLNAWVAGIAAGLCAMLLILAWPPVRRMLFAEETRYQYLMSMRKTLEFRALNHIRMLEGSEGLAWQCQILRQRVPALSEKKYERLILLSRNAMLVRGIRNVSGIRLYLQYLLQAREGYHEVRRDYVELTSRLAGQALPDSAPPEGSGAGGQGETGAVAARAGSSAAGGGREPGAGSRQISAGQAGQRGSAHLTSS